MSPGTLTGPAYGASPAPPSLATTAYVHDLDVGGTYRIVSVNSATSYSLSESTSAGGVNFTIPLFPPSLRVTIQQMTGVGTRAQLRSIQRVLPVSR